MHSLELMQELQLLTHFSHVPEDEPKNPSGHLFKHFLSNKKNPEAQREQSVLFGPVLQFELQGKQTPLFGKVVKGQDLKHRLLSIKLPERQLVQFDSLVHVLQLVGQLKHLPPKELVAYSSELQKLLHLQQSEVFR
jgi:hypothetical protein